MAQCCTYGLDSIPTSLRNCALVIGNFDGVHLGHQKIIATARELAGDLPVAALTFDPPPELALRPNQVPRRIQPNEIKCALLRQAGANEVIVAQTDAALLGMPPQEFVEQIIVRRFGAKYVVEGSDFHFGHKRGGDTNLLGIYGCHYGFAVHVVPPVMLDLPQGQVRISSSIVRQLLAKGHVEDAARCLGRPYALYGPIVAGQGKGRVLEFPTANLAPAEQIVPADGVYAGKVVIDFQEYPAAISLGNKPTLGPTQEKFIEAFLLDAQGDFYGRDMTLRFLRRLRGQQKFSGMEELKAQIARDVEAVREICGAAK